MKKCLILIIGLICFLVFSSQQGFAISISGSGGLGSFTGDISYDYDDSSSATLTVELTNTSDSANGGYITAFAFNNPNDNIDGVTENLNPLLWTDPDFGVIGGNDFDNGVNGQSLGWFDIGAGIGNNWTGGGPSSNGIGVGETVVFTFALIGNGMDDLTIYDFLNELEYFFGVHFRGFNHGKKDNVAASTPIPESTTIILLGTGIVGLGLYRRRFRTRKVA